MACTPPNTVSPGFLRLDYAHVSQGLVHGTRARLILGVDPLNAALMKSTADDWADAVAAICTSDFRFYGFTVLRPDGTGLYNGTLTSITAGSHVVATGALDYRSRTLAFTGHGLPGTVTTCAGEETSRVFVGAAFEWTPGQGYLISGLDGNVDALAAFLRNQTSIWADAYGQKASVRSRYPTQLNGYAQNHWGT